MVIKYVIRGGKVTESDRKKTVIAHLPDAHTSQFSSVLFRHKMYNLLTNHPNIKVHMNWTPGHRGVLGTGISKTGVYPKCKSGKSCEKWPRTEEVSQKSL